MDMWNSIYGVSRKAESSYYMALFVSITKLTLSVPVPKFLPMATISGAPELRQTRKDEVRARILDSFIAMMSEGDAVLNHDSLAKRSGVARRTVYRYFPDRSALMDAALVRVRELAGPNVAYPKSADDLLRTLEPIHVGFDAIAPINIMLRSTPQGRALRLSQKSQRVSSYTKALKESVKGLPVGDQKLATAVLQVLHTTPWLEMRDQWDLDGKQIARATSWAIRTLLNDLRYRRGLPLDEDAPTASLSRRGTSKKHRLMSAWGSESCRWGSAQNDSPNLLDLWAQSWTFRKVLRIGSLVSREIAERSWAP
jgi:AcrR family transcriptional regulator